MASLTQVAITTRKAVRYGIYLIIFLIIGRIVWGILVTVIQKVFPTPPPPPTVQFGKLPVLPFPAKNDVPNLTYTVQTPEGGLPVLPTQTKVYYMPPPKPDLLALDNAKQKASTLGFGNGSQLTQTIYKFSNQQNSSTLEMNIVNNTFSVGFNLNSDPSPLNSVPPAANIAANIAKGYLSQASLLPDDLTGPVTQEYLKVQNKQLVSAISQSEANLIRINMFRKDFETFPSVTANPNQANVWFIISGSQDQGKQIVGVQYYYYPIDETQFATYGLKTSDQAFKDLQASKGYVANLGNNPNGKITIRRVYLAYFDAGLVTSFYQPIIVFEGDNGFVAYIPAVASPYYPN